ncbi:MAG: hypothetical protein WKG32_15645 [Gemmatimonadaceae bacterium]
MLLLTALLPFVVLASQPGASGKQRLPKPGADTLDRSCALVNAARDASTARSTAGNAVSARAHPEFVLQEQERRALPDRVIPIAVAMLEEEGDVWAIDPKLRRIYAIPPGGPPRWMGTDADTGFTSIVAGHQRLLGVRAATLLSYDRQAGVFKTVGEIDTLAGMITSAAEDGRHLWLVTRKDTVVELLVFTHGGQTRTGLSRATARIRLPGGARLHALTPGRVLLARIDAPYSVSIFDTAARELTRFSPFEQPGIDSTALGIRASVISLAALPLDCRRVLQVLIDLRADTRWFLVHDIEHGRVARVRRITRPVGFTQAIPGLRVLLGFDDSVGRGEVVLYRWRWQ